MDPYKPPEDLSSEQPEREVKTPKCPQCGSSNTHLNHFLRSRPNVLFFILIGWMYLLARSAFSTTPLSCDNCGETSRHKTVGSWLALVVFIFLVLMITSGLILN